MNGNDLNNNNSSNIYRATGNLNTAIEDLNANNINSATEINIQGSDYSGGSSYNTYQDMSFSNEQFGNINNQFGNINNQFVNNSLGVEDEKRTNTFIGRSCEINPSVITNSNADVYMGEDAILADNSKKNVTYEPIIDNKKKPVRDQDSKLAKEGMTVIIMALLLVAFVMAMPYIYDFIREARLAFINR